MKHFVAAAGVCLFVLSSAALAAEAEKPAKLELKTLSQQASYVLGLDIGRDVRQLKEHLDSAALVRGLRDAIEGKNPLLTAKEAADVKQRFLRKLRADLAKKRAALGEKNRKAGEAFLAANKKKKGVVTTPSGLQYVVLRPGKGPKPKRTDSVRVHYRGALLDGKEFDSSYRRGRPETFDISRLTPGFAEALLLMNTGAKYKIFIPPKLAYGKDGIGDTIPPNAVLIFQIELLKIEPPKPATKKEEPPAR